MALTQQQISLENNEMKRTCQQQNNSTDKSMSTRKTKRFFGNQHTTPATTSTSTTPPAAKKQRTSTGNKVDSCPADCNDVRKVLDAELAFLEQAVDAEVAAAKNGLFRRRLTQWADSINRNRHLGNIIQYSKDTMYFAVSFYVTLVAAGLCRSKQHASEVVASALHKKPRNGRPTTFNARTVKNWHKLWEASHHGDTYKSNDACFLILTQTFLLLLPSSHHPSPSPMMCATRRSTSEQTRRS
jgi:hypothetical protein